MPVNTVFRALTGCLLALILLSVMADAAAADTIQLTCFETSMVSPIFIDSDGIKDTSSYNRTLEITIYPGLNIVTMSNNYGSSYSTGTFDLQITDSTYEWNDNVAYNNGYDHFVLDRYTLDLHSVVTPVPGGKVLQMQINYRCEKLQKQV